MAEDKFVIRPKKFRGTTAVVSARLPEDMIQALDRVSLHTGYNRNEIIMMCLEYAISRMEDTDGEEKK